MPQLCTTACGIVGIVLLMGEGRSDCPGKHFHLHSPEKGMKTWSNLAVNIQSMLRQNPQSAKKGKKPPQKNPPAACWSIMLNGRVGYNIVSPCFSLPCTPPVLCFMVFLCCNFVLLGLNQESTAFATEVGRFAQQGFKCWNGDNQ